MNEDTFLLEPTGNLFLSAKNRTVFIGSLLSSFFYLKVRISSLNPLFLCEEIWLLLVLRAGYNRSSRGRLTLVNECGHTGLVESHFGRQEHVLLH